MISELDLKVLKAILDDKVNALTFAYRYDCSLFEDDVKRFAKTILDYISHFKSPPTRRTLIDRHKNNSDLVQSIEESWDEIDALEHDIKEFPYNLEEIKKRFQLRSVEEIRAQAENIDIDSIEDPEDYFNKLSLAITRVTSLNLERTYIQKPIGDYVVEFSDSYESRRQNPEQTEDIKTGYSIIDDVRGGISAGELVIVGAETAGGKALSIDTPILVCGEDCRNYKKHSLYSSLNKFKTMGELKVGDMVYGDDGIPAKIIATTEIMYNHTCYELTFSNGEKIIADKDHIWPLIQTDIKYSYQLTTRLLYFKFKNNPELLELYDFFGTKHTNKSFLVKLVSIKEVDSVPVKCIQINNYSNCYLCGRKLIPTHNSMLLSNLAKQIWLQKNNTDTLSEDFTRGYNILYFSLEMPYKDCFNRFLASLADIPQKAITSATLAHDEFEKMNKALDFIQRYQEAGNYFDIVDVPRGVTIEEIELRYHDALARYRPDFVVVDYMGLMSSKEFAKEADWLKMGAIASSLHEFGRAYDVGMLTAAQLTDLKRNSQGNMDESKVVGVHRWGRSSLIMHNANLAIQIETRQHEKSLPDLKVHIVKDRRSNLCQGNLIKNFANAILINMPIDQSELPGKLSASIPDLIKSIQASKNKQNENS